MGGARQRVHGAARLTAYLAQATDRTTTSRLVGISWPAVGGIVKRVVARRLDSTRLAGLRRIGIDEFSYRKRHHYLTVVVDHDRRRVVWAGPGRSAEALGKFFDLLGEAGCARIELVTADLAASYSKAVRERVPQARVVYDRFHVERLAADAVDAVRRAEQHRLGATAAKALKGTRYALLHAAGGQRQCSGVEVAGQPVIARGVLKCWNVEHPDEVAILPGVLELPVAVDGHGSTPTDSRSRPLPPGGRRRCALRRSCRVPVRSLRSAHPGC